MWTVRKKSIEYSETSYEFIQSFKVPNLYVNLRFNCSQYSCSNKFQQKAIRIFLRLRLWSHDHLLWDFI